eukprot:SAG31_NODE_42080_length_273_cov_0.597701_1_plen_91_part_11
MNSSYTQSYPDDTKLLVQLVGDRDAVLRVTVFPPGSARADAQAGFREFMGDIAPSSTRGLRVQKKAGGDVVLSEDGSDLFGLTVHGALSRI